MTLEVFKSSLTKDNPPEEINDLLKALWYDANGDWERSHEIAQSINGKDAAWIHAFLHRKEGDIGNAGYWYNMAGRPMPELPKEEWEEIRSLEDEWETIVNELILKD